jgi:hypothetical protein
MSDLLIPIAISSQLDISGDERVHAASYTRSSRAVYISYYVAVGRPTTSSHGSSIAHGTPPTTFANSVNNIPRGGAGYDAYGVVNAFGSLFIPSTDGKVYKGSASNLFTTWSQQDTGTVDSLLAGMAFDGTTLITAVSRFIAYTTTGTGWAVHDTGADTIGSFKDLRFLNNKFIGCGSGVGTNSGPLVAYATSPTSWSTVITETGGTADNLCLCWTGSVWLAGNNHGEIWSSDDLVTWTKVLDRNVIFPLSSPYPTYMDSDQNGLVLAWGNNGSTTKLARSRNHGATWEELADPGFLTYALEYHAGYFYAGNNRTTDGDAWSPAITLTEAGYSFTGMTMYA